MKILFTAMLVAGLILVFTSAPGGGSCTAGTVVMNVTSETDVQALTDVLACAGEGSFNITWHGSLTIEKHIEVSNNKNVTITGADLTSTVRGTLGDDSTAGGVFHDGSGTGMFSVSNGSTLRLNHLVLEGGNAEKGGAVNVLSSSSLFVFECTFTRNSASDGGAIYAHNSDIHIGGNTSFSYNVAQGYKAAYSSSPSIGGNVRAYTSEDATASGGAIYLDSSVINIVGNIAFTSNAAHYSGGETGNAK